MNEWVLAGIAVVGTLVLAGGGAWIAKLVSGNNKEKAKDKA